MEQENDRRPEMLHQKNGEIKYFVCSFLRYSHYME